MGGKKYNKDGSKKPAGQAAPPTEKQPAAKPSTSGGSGGQQQSIAKEPDVRQSMEQLTVNEPVLSSARSEPKKKKQQLQQQQPKLPQPPQQWQQPQTSSSGGRSQQSTAMEPGVHQFMQQFSVNKPTASSQPTKQQQKQQKQQTQQTQQKQPKQQPKQQKLPQPPQQWQQPQGQQPQQRQQQQLPPQPQEKSGGPIQGQKQRAMPEQQPRHDTPQQQPKGNKNGPPIQVERNRTQGPSQHQSQDRQTSMPIEQLPRSVPRSDSSQSVRSVSSSSSTTAGVAHGGAIPKASKPEQSIAGKSMPLPKNLRALRPITKEPGTRGKELGFIETNYLQLDIKKIVENVYKYDVEIEIKKGPKKLNLAAFLKFCAQFLPNERGISYDWKKIAVTARKLNIEGELAGEVQIIHPNTGKTVDCKVTIKPAADGAMVPVRRELANYSREDANIEEAMQALDIIFKSVYNQHLDNGIRSGRSFFFTPKNGPPLPNLRDFYELRKGLFQSVVLGHDARNRKMILPLLNVDVTNKAFPTPYNSLIDLLNDMPAEYSTRNRRFDIDLGRPLTDDVSRKLHAHLAGLDLCYCSDGANKIVKKYFELGKVPAQETFEMNEEDGTKTRTTVENYFRNNLRRPIRYPNLQCIRMGNKTHFISVPLEFCSIIIQAVNKKCTENQTAAMIKHTAVSTDQRKSNIQQQVNSIQYSRSQNLAAFGITVNDKEFLKVPARQLQPPKIEYINGTVPPSKGQWRMDFGNKNFLKPAECLKWCVLNTDGYLNNANLDSFITELHRASQSSGTNLEKRPWEVKYQCRPNEIGQNLNRMAKQNVDIVVCVIPSKSANYAKVKKEAELVSGVLTQCIKADTISRRGTDRMTLLNILLKINAKLNGTNHRLSAPTSPILNNFDREPVMFIGADVTHPAPGLTNGYSVAAAVASHDRNAFCYNAGWRVQTGEIIADFETFVKDALLFFIKQNKKLPSKIFYFRDGVSDSQFKHVMEFKWDAMLKACAAVKPGYDKTVKVTIMIVQKRHRTRFFPGQNRISEDKNNNVPAGTVVDTIITRPDEAQYFLCSHQAIQGVARPTKYCILLDDGNHSMDDLQALTFNLCHMFARCNRSVSYPAPTYYAHLAAERGKVLLTDVVVDTENLDRFRQPIVQITAKYPMHFI